MVARGPWRPLTASQWRALSPESESPSLALFALPAAALAPFRELREAAALSRRGETFRISMRNHNHETRAFLDYAVDRWGAGRQPAGEPGGVHVNDPGLEATTINPVGRRRIGLHVDDWYRAPVSRRHMSPNRICVNLGCEDRFFLFLNLPMRRVYELSGAPRHASGSRAAQAFCRLFPHYPVLKLRMRPGEAYIAPTENLVHDGCSSGMRTPDVTLSLLGRFRVPGPFGR